MAYDFGLRLQTCRKKAGLSQRAVGELLGISGSAIGKFENNLSLPSSEKLKQLALIYHVSVDYLLNTQSNVEASAAEEKEDMLRTQLEILAETKRLVAELQKNIHLLEKSIYE